MIRASSVRDLAGLGIDFFATDLPLADAKRIRPPRIGLYKSYVPSIDEGWTSWGLEQFEFPYTSIYDKEVGSGNLANRFDVIVIPDQSVAAVVDGHPARSKTESAAIDRQPRAESRAERLSGPVPDQFTGGIGTAGVAALGDFVMQGGTLVTLNRASNFPIDRLTVGVRNIFTGRFQS